MKHVTQTLLTRFMILKQNMSSFVSGKIFILLATFEDKVLLNMRTLASSKTCIHCLVKWLLFNFVSIYIYEGLDCFICYNLCRHDCKNKFPHHAVNNGSLRLPFIKKMKSSKNIIENDMLCFKMCLNIFYHLTGLEDLLTSLV